MHVPAAVWPPRYLGFFWVSLIFVMINNKSLDNKVSKGLVSDGAKGSTLLRDAPILKSILKKAHRNIPPTTLHTDPPLSVGQDSSIC